MSGTHCVPRSRPRVICNHCPYVIHIRDDFGPLAKDYAEKGLKVVAINANDLVATSVLSGNRNFEGRISPDVRANYLASPPLVVAYAIAGSRRGTNLTLKMDSP